MLLLTSTDVRYICININKVAQYCDTIWHSFILYIYVLSHYTSVFNSAVHALAIYLSGGQEAILNVNAEA